MNVTRHPRITKTMRRPTIVVSELADRYAEMIYNSLIDKGLPPGCTLRLSSPVYSELNVFDRNKVRTLAQILIDLGFELRSI